MTLARLDFFGTNPQFNNGSRYSSKRTFEVLFATVYVFMFLLPLFLRDFGALHTQWRKKEYLLDVEVACAKALCVSIGTCWQI